MLTIRLARVGHKGQARFRIVAADKRRHVQAKFVEILGHYDPHSKELVVNQEQLNKHLQNGAQPSSTVVKLLKRQKIKLPKWAEANLVIKKKAPKAKKTEAEVQAPAAPAAEAKSEPAASPAKASEGKAEAPEKVGTKTKEAPKKKESKKPTEETKNNKPQTKPKPEATK